MDKDLLKIKISKCFVGRECHIDFDPDDHFGWLNLRCSCCIFPVEIERLRKFLYVSTICASIDYVHRVPFIEIYCCYKDVEL